MKLSEKTFQVLDTLDRQEISTQRQLADHSGISLGQVNYILKNLLEKGLVKIGNFRKNPHKIGYLYLLTPEGIEAKSRLAYKFVILKLKEYEDLSDRLTEQLANIRKQGNVRVVFVGPSLVKEFISSTIKKDHLDLVLIGHFDNWKDLENIDPESFDIALLFDDSLNSLKEIEEVLKIPRDRLLTLL